MSYQLSEIVGLFIICGCCVLPIAAPIMWAVRRRRRQEEKEIVNSLYGDFDIAPQPAKRKLLPVVIRFESRRATNYVNLIFVAIALTYAYGRFSELMTMPHVDSIEWYKLGGILLVAIPLLIYQIRVLNRATIRFDLRTRLIKIGRGKRGREIAFAEVANMTLRAGAKIGFFQSFGYMRRILSITLLSGETIDLRTFYGRRESLDRQFFITGHKVAEALRGEGTIFAQTMRQYNLARNFSEAHPYVYSFYDPNEEPLDTPD